MATRVVLAVETDGPTAASRFIHEYVLDAVDRVGGMDACDSFNFVPSQPVEGDRTAGIQVPPPGHEVYLTIRGDTEEIIAAEREHWDGLVDEGVIADWEVQTETDREELVAELGEERTALLAAQSDLSARMAALAYETYAEVGTVPAPVETFPKVGSGDDEPDETGDDEREAAPFGWWGVLHTVTVQLNYGLEEELEAYTYCIEHGLRNLAEFEGPEAATERLDELVTDLEGKREAIAEGRHDT